MTISSATARASYNGDGATVSFSTAFAFLDNSHVAVIHRSTTGVETTWTEGTQYTLTGAGTGSAGTVTVSTVPTDYTPASGERLVVLRDVPATQNRDLPAGGSFPSQTVEEGLDQLTMLVQQLLETQGRTLRFGETSTAEATLPDPTANNLIGWNSAGDDLTNIALTAVLAEFDTVLTALADGDFISYDAATEKWVNRTPAEVRSDIGALQNVLTTRGDIVIATTSGAAARLAKGASGQVLTMGADEPAWGDSGAFPAGYLYGLTLRNDTDADHDVEIASGKCRDDDDSVNMTLSAALTKRIDAAWAVGDNNGGLDTGTVANSTTYHVHLIRRSDTGVVDALFSTSATSPTMPSNYDSSRRVGSVVTDGSANIRGFRQRGDAFRLKAAVLDVDVSNLGTTPTNYALTVPAGIEVEAEMNVVAHGAEQLYYLYPTDATDQAASDTAAPLATTRRSAGTTDRNGIPGPVRIWTDTSRQIRAVSSGASGEIAIATLGWIDTRGRL